MLRATVEGLNAPRAVAFSLWLCCALALAGSLAGCSADNANRPPGGPAGSSSARRSLETPPGQGLVGPTWRWIETRVGDGTAIGAPADSADRYTVAFSSADGGLDGGSGGGPNGGGTVQVMADCNSGSGPFAVTELSQLTIGPLVVTDAACAEGSESERFLRHLQAATSYVVQSGRLELGLADVEGVNDGASGIMVLAP